MTDDNVESLEDLKYLLGNMGLEILLAIEKGASNVETIRLFSGIPKACIKGRIPVLHDLSLIDKNERGYYLTKKGNAFKAQIEKKNEE